GLDDLVALALQHGPQAVAQLHVVIDDEDDFRVCHRICPRVGWGLVAACGQAVYTPAWPQAARREGGEPWRPTHTLRVSTRPRVYKRAVAPLLTMTTAARDCTMRRTRFAGETDASAVHGPGQRQRRQRQPARGGRLRGADRRRARPAPAQRPSDRGRGLLETGPRGPAHAHPHTPL